MHIHKQYFDWTELQRPVYWINIYNKQKKTEETQ